MGNKDTVTKKYLSDPARFADIVNNFVYGGRQVVKPENLEEKDPTELTLFNLPKRVASRQRMRDILKMCSVKRHRKSGQDAYFVMFGIENQTDIHYAMPVKNALYDFLNYGDQVNEARKRHGEAGSIKGAELLSGFLKEDRLIPVVTLVVYFGVKPWDGPRSLHEMFPEDTDRRILRMVPDYRINLITPEDIGDLSKFQTEFGPVMEAIRCSDNRSNLRALMQSTPAFSEMSMESVEVLNVIIGLKVPTKRNGGPVDMCKAWEEYAEEKAAEAREETKAEMCKAWEEYAEERAAEAREETKAEMCKAWEEYAEERAAEEAAKAAAEAEVKAKAATAKSILNMLREGASVDFLAKTMEGVSRKEIEDLAAEVLKK